LYCIVSIHLYSASCSAHQSEALPVRENQREDLDRCHDFGEMRQLEQIVHYSAVVCLQQSLSNPDYAS